MANRPIVGVGVLLWRGANLLVGCRKGSHGAGTYALPGGHLEYGESFVECAVREVLEETGIQLDASKVKFEYSTSSIFTDIKKHYVTIFMSSHVEEGIEAQLFEPEKCEGWIWTPYTKIPDPIFLPLQSLLQSEYKPPHLST